ncbi:MAG: DNA polymerase III, subunit gamma and tau [Bacteroidetes bacterium GWD2_45_23]|nr:MAG: DNA polymerase III, subunit gamma and tau [Bacteroidetes bacterium GWC2_46_850]OFX82243.1 MAG: DNA polymerase III, subunit gamma and tau [Bacteroidetes bacterium GWC1_47_7]OFX87743.1 MAG: DNA polymerase III, subunit gamma and tau [Bacteroidetes bacterium GWD2_45_23]HAR38232.1 DNA polymerase III subunit gamma/tau [Porphyromonadaceae bacterium]HBB01522.1 DNA polymerase III subunit gamma/tau [Porphyromonadaceae bacterium]
MDTFIVSARKYRPSTFRSVVGQEALTTTLKNAIAGSKLAHAYLFSGPRGVGKTTCARIFAKTINCLNPTNEYEACNACESCVAFNEQRSYNIHELDAASNNSVDDIRSLIDQVRVPPQIGKYKVYIIDEVHMLSQSAFNSFLKTLEEPPAHAIFILATTEKHKIIPTILSRCQVYDFNRIHIGDIVAHLQYVAQEEGVQTEPEALNIIAQKADGGMRDALSIFDQTVSYTGGDITYQAVVENLNVLDYEYYFKLSEAIFAGDVVNSLLILNDILNRGFEGQYIISGISSHFRDLLVCKDPATAQLFQVGSSIREKYIAMAQQCSNDFMYRAIELANDCDLNYRLSKNKRLLLELTLIKLCQLTEDSAAERQEKKKAIEPITVQKKEQTGKTVARPEKTERLQQESDRQLQASEEVNPITAVQPEKESGKPAATKRKSVSMAGMGISLASINHTQKKEVNSSSEEVRQNGTNLFTEEELIAAWESYAAALKKEVLLKNTMSLYPPRMLNDVVFEVEVNTELNKQYLTDNSLSILSHLRETLQNGEITMTIRIAEDNVIKKPLTSREIFDEMVQQNPSLQKLSNEFGLELN